MRFLMIFFSRTMSAICIYTCQIVVLQDVCLDRHKLCLHVSVQQFLGVNYDVHTCFVPPDWMCMAAQEAFHKLGPAFEQHKINTLTQGLILLLSPSYCERCCATFCIHCVECSALDNFSFPAAMTHIDNLSLTITGSFSACILPSQGITKSYHDFLPPSLELMAWQLLPWRSLWGRVRRPPYFVTWPEN